MDNELASIVERLKAIEKILSDYIETIRSAEERDRELKLRPQPVRAEITFDDASKSESQTEANRQNATQEAIRRAALYAFGAAILYAGLAWLQLSEMRTQTAQVFSQSDVENANASRRTAEVFEQLKIAQKQADAAQDQVKVLAENMRMEQRAWIGLEPINIPQDVGAGSFVASIWANNTGNTPAIRATFRDGVIEPLCTALPANPFTLVKSVVRRVTGPINPHDRREGMEMQLTIPVEDFDLLKTNPQCRLYFFAEAKYSDIFEREHYRHFCAYWISNTPRRFALCDTYNDGDEDNQSKK